MSESEPDQDRQQQIIAAVVKVVGVALAIGLAIGLGTWILVKALGLDSTDTTGQPIQVDPITPSALPTTALPDPTQSSDPTETESPSEPSFTSSPGDEKLLLSASPLFVDPMQRINLTGQWPGRDAVPLLVQRFEDGEWVNFGVQVQVTVGTFDTYVLTGREGDNKFRVFDPETETASNAVSVTVGD
ncbi:hypothetical protein EFK50_19225 [Nocardioides marmoriginsengisoli]|uniref:Uncharacterized protein n=1 Tax=Nocardioides marmoriginsengisoli TaxID=661483 RepID=A0A3N0CAX2_9ACTN|nr:hypothetical protein [Nocardioides marmoriginsengisoli]RNL60459.1 hypothetical protein EFK50_19225 [Nocardioides marmoriginsengisoli]